MWIFVCRWCNFVCRSPYVFEDILHLCQEFANTWHDKLQRVVAGILFTSGFSCTSVSFLSSIRQQFVAAGWWRGCEDALTNYQLAIYDEWSLWSCGPCTNPGNSSLHAWKMALGAQAWRAWQLSSTLSRTCHYGQCSRMCTQASERKTYDASCPMLTVQH